MYTDAEKKVKFNLNNDPESDKPLCTEISWREFFDDATLKEAEHPKTQRKIWSLNKNWEALYGRFAPDKEDILVLLVAGDPELHEKLKANVLRFLPESRLIDPMAGEGIWDPSNWVPTQCGRHSYGALCNHPLVARVGNFCSFAAGADVVNNHQVNLLSTSPFLVGRGFDRAEGFRQVPYKEFHAEKWYVPGIHPRGTVKGFRRITIGHDVWLGKNVTITNYSDIGNGVIAGAGAVITKPVPDFAVVVGVPAHIVRYRYTKEQIKALNKIQWWNWSDEQIRERVDDMYLSIEDFIEKYL